MSQRVDLQNRIDLSHIPFTERGSRLLLFRQDEELFIRLAERWIKYENLYGPHRQRAPIIDHMLLLDATDRPLHFTINSNAYSINLITGLGVYTWTFLDAETLLLRIPPGTLAFEFDCMAEAGQTDRRGGTLDGVRNIAYTTNTRILENTVEQTSDLHFKVRLKVESDLDGALLLNITPRLGFNRSLPNPDDALDDARLRWRQWFEAAPPVLDRYRAQYDYAWWVMRAGLMSPRFYITRETIMPSKVQYVGVWQWDQFFHAIAFRHLDARLAEDQLRILLDHQQPNGMIPDAIHDEGLITHLDYPVSADVTKPPLLAWAVLKLYEKSGHIDFLQEVYEALKRSDRWWFEENSDGRGLCVYRHPFSSGLDDNPLWDYGMPVTSPDLNTYLCIHLESLARIASLIGEEAEAAEFQARGAELAQRMIDVLWDEKKGVFNALHNDEVIPVLTPFNVLPLWIKDLPEHISERLVANLIDPELFWTPWPLATVSVSDSHFNPTQMWRGPTWVNINYLFIEALMRTHRIDLAAELRRKTLDMIMLHDDIYEYYNPLSGERPPKAAPIFGWTSAVFIDLAIQETQAVLTE
ncbi:MAG TPA: trehalase family glycosidase [Phototrophicaceae bacterium]|nr:trehalase family glycosidase [Phototrophicaceae bacterium]